MKKCNKCILCLIRKIPGVLSVSGLCPPCDKEIYDKNKYRVFFITTKSDIKTVINKKGGTK
jgi:hypothetical protein